MTDGQKLNALLLKILRRHSKIGDSQKLMELESIVYALYEAVEGRDEESHDDNWLSIPSVLDSILGWFPVEEEHI
jgi:hypothetical protein